MDGVRQRIYADQIKSYRISKSEVLQEQGRQIARLYNLKAMEKFALEKFALLDQNSDEFVTKEELRAVLKSKQLPWREVNLVTFLLEHLQEIQGAEFGDKVECVLHLVPAFLAKTSQSTFACSILLARTRLFLQQSLTSFNFYFHFIRRNIVHLHWTGANLAPRRSC